MRKRTLVTITSILLTCLSCQSQKDEIEIVVHRGANHLAPENTMASTWECIKMGVAYVEVDVRTSKDGVLYILHDSELDRTTNGSGRLKEKLSSEIDTLDAGSWFGDKFAGEKVPRVKDFLKEVKGKTKIYFDFKNGNLQQMIDIVYEYGFENDCFFWFGNHDYVIEFRKLTNSIPLKMNAKNLEDLEQVMSFNPQIIECDVSQMTEEFVKLCRANNLKIMAYGKDTKEAYKEVLKSPADMVNLNKPELMLSLLSR